MKGYDPKNSYSTCFVLVPDLAALHRTFSSGLRSHYGRLPTAGIPRISKLNNSNSDRQFRFNVIDPGGNWVRFAQKGEQPAISEDAPPQKEPQTKLARATHAADLVVEAEGDFEAAARMLDKALAQGDGLPVERVRALTLRAAAAISLGDMPAARQRLSEARAVQLREDERAALADVLQRADDMEAMLS